MHGADREPRPEWIIFTRGSEHPVSKSMEVMEVFAMQRFVRLAGRHLGGAPSCPWRVLLCFPFFWMFRFSVWVLPFSLFFAGRKEVKGILSEPGWEGGWGGGTASLWRSCLMWRWSDHEWRLMGTINPERSRVFQLHLLDLFPRRCFHLCTCVIVPMKEELHSKERGQFTVAFRLLPGKGGRGKSAFWLVWWIHGVYCCVVFLWH